MEYWTQLEIDCLQRAEGVLDAAETFVGAHRGSGIGFWGRRNCADHIEAVERGLGGNAERVLGKAERLVGDGDLEVFGHVASSQHRTNRLTDDRGAAQRTARLLHAG